MEKFKMIDILITTVYSYCDDCCTLVARNISEDQLKWKSSLVKYFLNKAYKTCPFPIFYLPCSISCYSIVFLRGLRDFRKNSTKNTCISLSCFLLRMYFYNSIFISRLKWCNNILYTACFVQIFIYIPLFT